MTELETRLHATNIVDRLRLKHADVSLISLVPDGSGLHIRVTIDNVLITRGVFDGELLPGLEIECHIPPGHFSYDRIADVILRERDRATVES